MNYTALTKPFSDICFLQCCFYEIWFHFMAYSRIFFQDKKNDLFIYLSIIWKLKCIFFVYWWSWVLFFCVSPGFWATTKFPSWKMAPSSGWPLWRNCELFTRLFTLFSPTLLFNPALLSSSLEFSSLCVCSWSKCDWSHNLWSIYHVQQPIKKLHSSVFLKCWVPIGWTCLWLRPSRYVPLPVCLKWVNQNINRRRFQENYIWVCS